MHFIAGPSERVKLSQCAGKVLPLEGGSKKDNGITGMGIRRFRRGASKGGVLKRGGIPHTWRATKQLLDRLAAGAIVGVFAGRLCRRLRFLSSEKIPEAHRSPR